MTYARSLFILLLSTTQLWAGRSDFNFSVGLPDRKRAVEVHLRRNPFSAAAEPERPLPVVRDKDDPVVRVPALVAPHLRSVVRDPQRLLLLEDSVFQEGDELRVRGEALLSKHRVHLKSIEADRLVFHVVSLDPQQPGEVEAFLALGASMRRN